VRYTRDRLLYSSLSDRWGEDGVIFQQPKYYFILIFISLLHLIRFCLWTSVSVGNAVPNYNITTRRMLWARVECFCAHIMNGFVLLVDPIALLGDRLLAPPLTDHAAQGTDMKSVWLKSPPTVISSPYQSEACQHGLRITVLSPQFVFELWGSFQWSSNVCKHSLCVDKFTWLFYLLIQLVQAANNGRLCRWWL